MDDVESRLRRTLTESLDGIEPERGRAAPALRRARRGRAARGAAAGLACLLVVAATAVAWERRQDDRPAPAGERADVKTFVVSFPRGGRATVTIDVRKAQACVAVQGGGVTLSGHLHYDPAGPDPTVAELHVPPRHLRWPQCDPVDQGDAARVIAEPHRHYLDLHPDPAVRAGVLRPLELAAEDAPDVAEIVCSQDGAVALTPEVQPQEDGIHLRFYNPSRRWRAFNLFDGEGHNEGGDLGFGRDDNVSTFPPGTLYAGCFDDLDDSFSPGDAEYTELTIVDPRRLWTELDLACGTAYEERVVDTDEPSDRSETQVRGGIIAPVPSDTTFPEMARDHVPGLRDEDDIRRPGYPETALHFNHHNVFRDGVAVARLMFVDGPEVWEIRVGACPGTGVGEPEG
ncbi:MAG: hypothetical protein ABR613_11020 [Actinomycetota bacterium]